MRTLALLSAALVAVPLAAGAQEAAPPPPAPPADAEPVLPGTPLEAISFEEAVRRSARAAPSAAIAAEEVIRAEALLVEARAGSLPALAATGSETWLREQVRNGPAVVAASPQTAASVTLSVPLFAPSRWFQWAHASDQVRVARASEADTRRLVTLTAARAYLGIISQKRAIEVSRRAVEVAQAHFDFARTRRQGGIGNALDEARADQQLATSQAQLENAAANLVRLQEALGIATGSRVPVDAGAEPDLRFGGGRLEDVLAQARERRTDAQAARERADAAHRVTRDSWADWLPTLGAQGGPTYLDPRAITTPRSGWQTSGQLVLTFPIFEGFLRVGQLRERQAIEAESRTALDATLLQVDADVRTAVSTLARAEASLAVSRRGAERARSALSLVQEAYRAGATTSLDVVDAERQARDADSAAVIAEDAVRQARLDLLSAAGRFP
jgi:outer membrane protein TolC